MIAWLDHRRLEILAERNVKRSSIGHVNRERLEGGRPVVGAKLLNCHRSSSKSVDARMVPCVSGNILASVRSCTIS